MQAKTSQTLIEDSDLCTLRQTTNAMHSKGPNANEILEQAAYVAIMIPISYVIYILMLRGSQILLIF